MIERQLYYYVDVISVQENVSPGKPQVPMRYSINKRTLQTDLLMDQVDTLDWIGKPREANGLIRA